MDMSKLRRIAAIGLIAGIALLGTAGAASAGFIWLEVPVTAEVITVDAGETVIVSDDASFGVDGIEAGLVALFPLVILLSSVLLKSEASKAVKQALPAVVAAVVATVYFIVDVFPGFGAELVVNMGLLIGLALKMYDPLSAGLEVVTSLRGGTAKGINDVTGPGVIGAAAGEAV